MTAPKLDPMDLLSGLVIDDVGTRWGDLATDFQRADAHAILTGTSPSDVRLHFETRPRGGSKTTDLAAVLLVVLITQAPRRSTSHAYARDLDQSGLLLDAIRALAERSGLAGLLEFGATGVKVKATNALLRVESADAGSAFGRIPFFVVVDELAAWPATRSAKTLWEAITSGLPKRRDSRLVVLTSAGDPAHWSARVIEAARQSERWRVSETPGPLPWMSPEDLAVQQELLPASMYARLHLNVWTAGEDRLVRLEDLRACVVHEGVLPYDGRYRYQLGLDLGTVNDRAVLTVAHAESRDGAGPLIVLDKLVVWHPSRERPLNFADVEKTVLLVHNSYGQAPLRTDPRDAVDLAQRLRDKGMRVEEWNFSTTSVGRLGATLHRLLRDHRMALPADEELLDELLNVRLRESAPGVYRLDHDAGQHDDRAVSLALAALALTERAEGADGGGISVPSQVHAQMQARQLAAGGPGMGTSLLNPAYAARPLRGALADARAAEWNQTEAQRRAGLGLVVPGSVNDRP